MTQPLVAIIGAGLSGLAVACRLRDAGVNCVNFDKSRGVSGRMATRRADHQGTTLRFDHGTGYLTPAQADRIAALFTTTSRSNREQPLQRLCNTANLRPWSHGSNLEATRLVSPYGINTVGKALATDLDIKLSTAITQADWDPARYKWRLSSENPHLHAHYDLLITTTPPAQAANILAAYQGPVMPLLRGMQPLACWTLMLGAQSPLNESALNHRGAIIDRVVSEHSKDRPHPNGLSTYTIQAAREWSQEHVETPAKDVAHEILHELKTLGWDGSGIEHQQVHRWRYAGVANPGSEPCLVDPEHRLICAGDWCVGNDLDSALTSAGAAADQALAMLA